MREENRSKKKSGRFSSSRLRVDGQTRDLLAKSRQHLKFLEDVIRPTRPSVLPIDYEMEPGKDVRYS